MKKNNKGFFLAETIVVIALVTTVMAFVYPNVTKLYENYKNRVNYYDQTEDLYALKAVYEANKEIIYKYTIGADNCIIEDNKPEDYTEKVGKNISEPVEVTDSLNKPTILGELYISSYMLNLSPKDNYNYNFNKYLKRLKKTTYDGGAYRLIGIFEKKDGSGKIIETRYASIKIDNPNPDRYCNLGGKQD